MSLRDVFVIKEHRDIVVTIPKAKRSEIEAEEADVSRREAVGEKGISYYWAMKRLPKERPRRIYFVWDDAVRAYHDVIGMEDGKIYMSTKINQLEEPVPMKSFMGYRYFGDKDV